MNAAFASIVMLDSNGSSAREWAVRSWDSNHGRCAARAGSPLDISISFVACFSQRLI
jgi:hypothetical protein